jgi:predicted negative regulator of RcsB-dependent stress response
MNAKSLVVIFSFLSLAGNALADVVITELPDRIQVKIEDQVFTEWRHKDWVAPFLYPVIGPNGENVTRHYPMKDGIPGEDADHPWHRSLRFSHSDVNGFNFWWAPGQERAGHTAEVKLEKIEAMRSGKTGEVVLWNQWLGNGKLVLREKVRLSFEPLADREVLMDYDIELHAADTPVVFGDKRDGGLLVRVAGAMKVEDAKGNPGAGTIVNSRGDKNAAAWGKRAEWADYSGPDASGKTVGIAIFDHPSNLRFPTHWHARMYGLMTANRFGTDHFKMNYDDHKTVICAPAKGHNCAACASHSGDFTLEAGKSLVLKQRFYIHHGDAQSGNVAEQYRRYTSDRTAVLPLMQAMFQDRRWKELIARFGKEDFAAWPADMARQASEALQIRGQVRSYSKEGPEAARDLQAALRLKPRDQAILLLIAENAVNNLNDSQQAIATYQQVLEISGPGPGWQPLTATTALAKLYMDDLRLEDALDVLKPYGDFTKLPDSWRIRLLRSHAQILAAQGKDAEALARFREALKLETPR